MKKILSALLAVGLLSTPAMSLAGDAAAGKAKAATCAGCHGAEGISANTLWPNLAGQKEGYLKKAIKDFRDGKRTDPMMAAMVKPLSDADIDDLAAYYSQL